MIPKSFETMLAEIELTLQRAFQNTPADLQPIDAAMSYSLLSGGKRLRALIPLLVLDTYGYDWHRAIYPACALECIHTYSLVHDDLPCMDNDDLRRGKPTNHKVFGDALALLAGDGLLTEAFQILAFGAQQSAYDAATALRLVRLFACSAGRYGMIGGQVLDMQSSKLRQAADLRRMHELKTGALLKTAFLTGAILAQADAAEEKLWQELGNHFGLFFQIQDDILDMTGEEALLGKPIGSDLKNDKFTYVSCFGLIQAQSLCEKEYEKLLLLLQALPVRQQPLLLLFEWLHRRQT
ncbi:MAG: polyprenyl synthetase family protein [Negativicutes bacterium]|nr:polyprenyl synthetase family protein [Negativicutes bacterium]